MIRQEGDETKIANCEANVATVLRYAPEWRNATKFNAVTKKLEIRNAPGGIRNADALDVEIAMWFQTSGWQRRDWRRAVARTRLFGDVEHVLVEHVHELPREALADHLLSYSGLAALPEDERRREFAAVADILDADPSLHDRDRLRLPFPVAPFRATRT